MNTKDYNKILILFHISEFRAWIVTGNNLWKLNLKKKNTFSALRWNEVEKGKHFEKKKPATNHRKRNYPIKKLSLRANPNKHSCKRRKKNCNKSI